MDLEVYKARGFSTDFDRVLAETPVKGIDREQAQSMIRLCDETESILYGNFSPRKIRYFRGARPVLEKIAAELRDPSDVMNWVADNVAHPSICGPTPADRAMTEEQLIASGRGWCNEQCRVFIALCEVMDIPARLCFLFHANGKTAHTATEIYQDGAWEFYDVQYRVHLPFEARALSRERQMARSAYLGTKGSEDLLASIGICNYLIEGVEAC